MHESKRSQTNFTRVFTSPVPYVRFLYVNQKTDEMVERNRFQRHSTTEKSKPTSNDNSVALFRQHYTVACLRNPASTVTSVLAWL